MYKSLCGNHFSQKLKMFNALLLSIGLLLPWHAVAIQAHPHEATQQKEQAEERSQHVHNSDVLRKKAKRAVVKTALGELSCVHSQSSIIRKNEWQELQLDWLADRLDDTQTSFGRWALGQMLYPVADKDEIVHKQNIIKLFAEDEKLSTHIKRFLDEIAQSEDELIAYWNEAEFKEADRLFCRAESFYFSLFKTKFPELCKRLNNSRLALEGGTLMSMYNIAMLGISFVGWNGLKTEFSDWSEGRTPVFNPIRGILRHFIFSYRSLNPFRDKSIHPDGTTKYDGSLLSYSNILLNGTFGDRLFVGSQGYDHEYKSQVPSFGLSRKFPFITCKLVEKDLWKFRRVTEHDPLIFKGAYGLIGLAEAVSPAALALGSAYMLGRSIKNSYSSFVKTMRELHERMNCVARTFEGIKELARAVSQHESLGSSCIAEHMNRVFGDNNISKKLRKLLTLLNTSTFKPGSSPVYSRGRVLLAHKLMQEIKKELVPALQAVGELDAYLTLAQKCKSHDGKQPEYTFVEFIDSQTPYLKLDRCSIPVLDKPVENSITLGGDQAGKLVITGPNGGGKSTILKMLGHVVVLAQSFGIVPAVHARSTIFTGLRTCLHPEEDLMNNMSTFMAEKKRIDEIEQFVGRRAPGQKIMLLLDEPFKGTVDAESAERIYQFGKKVADLSQLIVCIATHVKKPVSLEYDTQHAFANRHVEIAEHADGTFERLFTLRQGPAEWWFSDTAKRARYVDWLGTQYELTA